MNGAFKMKDVMKNIEKNTAKFIKKEVYRLYLYTNGTHEERLDGMWKSLSNIVLPPMTERLKKTITDYIVSRNNIFDAILCTTIGDASQEAIRNIM
jgi:hypothetical protein